MRFTGIFSAFVVAASAVSAAQVEIESRDSIGVALTLTAANHYGAPIPPWEVGCTPGWYYGAGLIGGVVIPILDGVLCAVLDLLPFVLHCPPPYPPPPPPPNSPPKYRQSFHNLTCAAQDSSYLTYGLVDTVIGCQAMCDAVTGCKFFNTYHDVNGKNGSPQLTCALFSASCLGASSADNCGGQKQPDGSTDYITNSDGYCHN
ncbi:unnamed protein product [Mycena citricolor]|uniref:Fruit-body specific protein a n=1 Tax=Mycena citricolor TaxID=2018698 RepID=A0AAD2JU97_9AGAR|nr:unnamed protein product [Mycena citricolor]